MEYTIAKCVVIHFGRNNSKMDYYLNGEKLQLAAVQRDLGVIVHETQKVGLQVRQPSEEEEALLCLLDCRIHVGSPGQVVGYRHSEELDAVNPLNLSSVDVDGDVFSSFLSEAISNSLNRRGCRGGSL
eukprot:g35678.t1